MKYLFLLLLITPAVFAQQRVYTAANGHSHNDYRQNIPFLLAYYAGMGSIEADVYLRDGRLLVAHDKEELPTAKTLESLYLQAITKVPPDTARKLQLLIDIKESYKDVIPALVKALQPYLHDLNRHAVRIVLSGNIPPPENFADYPDYIFYDGRPGILYTPAQLKRIAMISDNLRNYSVWNGKGTPTPEDAKKLTAVVRQAHDNGKPFRFWGTKDNPNTWSELEKLGADWIGTDHPEDLRSFYAGRERLQYTSPAAYNIYQPTYAADGAKKRVKNVILLIGDGMGLAQIQAALTANGGVLNLSMFRHIGLSRTEAVNSDITDSAAGGTAMASGKKTNNRYVGVDTAGHPLTEIPDTLSRYGIKSGIISSGDVTDATPAAFYAHQPERSSSFKIAADLLTSNIDILVGSNRKSFIRNPDAQLMKKLQQKGFTYSSDLAAFNSTESGKHLVLLHDSVCRPVKKGRGTMLQASLEKTVSLLSANEQGFFIMAEGAQIDYGGHANDLPYVITELHDFDRMVGDALRFADKDGETLVIVTADHETGGLSIQDASYRRRFVRGHFSSDDHTDIMVPVFAYGPGAAAFMGMYENTGIFDRIVRLMTER